MERGSGQKVFWMRTIDKGLEIGGSSYGGGNPCHYYAELWDVTEPLTGWDRTWGGWPQRKKDFCVHAWLGSSWVMSLREHCGLYHQNTNGSLCRWKNRRNFHKYFTLRKT